MSRRSGSRWDNRSRDRRYPQHRGQNGIGSGSGSGNYSRDENQRNKAPAPSRSISDEDAMRALLSSAEERAREREGKNDDHNRHQRRGDGRDRNNNLNNKNGYNRGRSSRWGEEGRSGNRSNSNEVSYYGPGVGADRGRRRGNDDTDYDRKRKRLPERESERERHESRRGGGNNHHRGDTGPHRVEDDRDERKSKTNGADDKEEEEEKPPPEFKPNFGLSGALAKDTQTGNVYKGVVLKFREPPEARAPNTQWRLYVFKARKSKDGNDSTKKNNAGDDKDKDNDLIETLHISKQSAYLFGRNTDVADIPLLHPSLSGQHAVLQYRGMPVPSETVGGPPRLSCRPYIMDLESTNGTFLNGVRIDAARYYELRKGDVLTFGASTREYVLLTQNTTSIS